jgi:hypothetical protein
VIESVIRLVEARAEDSTKSTRIWLNRVVTVLERLQKEAEEEEREIVELLGLL